MLNPVPAVVMQMNSGRSNSSCFIAPFRFLTNPCEHFDAGSQFGRWNVGKQFMSKFVRHRFDLSDNALGAPAKQHFFATAIPVRIPARDPIFPLQTMQQCHDRWLFDAKSRSDLRLSERVGRERQMQERAPLCLAQAHRL
jgi:hypothetical protein